jgi:hypothetical protein
MLGLDHSSVMHYAAYFVLGMVGFWALWRLAKKPLSKSKNEIPLNWQLTGPVMAQTLTRLRIPSAIQELILCYLPNHFELDLLYRYPLTWDCSFQVQEHDMYVEKALLGRVIFYSASTCALCPENACLIPGEWVFSCSESEFRYLMIGLITFEEAKFIRWTRWICWHQRDALSKFDFFHPLRTKIFNGPRSLQKLTLSYQRQ